MTLPKLLIVASVLSLFFSKSIAQPPVRVIGYEQAVLPGTIPSGVTDEQGNPMNTSRAGHTTNYFIYFLYSPTARVVPTTLWIGGQCFDFKPEAIPSTPVKRTFPGNDGQARDQVMVPRTTMKVMRLNVTAPCKKPIVRPPLLKKGGTPAAVLISYKFGGKTYNATLKELTVMPPLMHQ